MKTVRWLRQLSVMLAGVSKANEPRRGIDHGEEHDYLKSSNFVELRPAPPAPPDPLDARLEELAEKSKLLPTLEGEEAIEVIKALGKIGDEPAIRALLKTFEREGFGSDIRRLHNASKRALVQIASPAVEPLIGALNKGRHPNVREAAALVLGEIGDKRAVEPLLELLKECAEYENYGDEESDVITLERIEKENIFDEVATALGKLKDECAVNHLVGYLKAGKSEYKVAKALGELGSQGEKALTDLLDDENLLTRTAAAYGLEQVQTELSVRVLSEIFRSEDIEAQKEAARMLGWNHGEGMQILIRALRDRDARIRKVAAWGLGEAECSDARDALERAKNDADPEVREAVKYAILAIHRSENPDNF